MLDGNEDNGVRRNHGLKGDGAVVATAARIRKRVLTRDLSAQIAELEGRIEVISATLSKPEAPSPLERKVAELADQIAKLDQRVTKIAQMVAQSNLLRGPLS